VKAPARESQTRSAHPRQVSHRFDLLASHLQTGGLEGQAVGKGEGEGEQEGEGEGEGERGENGVNMESHPCSFLLAHVHRQSGQAG
jgi:hypothetical protein